MASGAARILSFWWVAWLGSLAALVFSASFMTLNCHLALNRTRYTLIAVESVLQAFRAKEGHYPDESIGLDALMAEHRYRVGTDSWGNEYVYRPFGATWTPMVYSRGADGLDSLGQGDDVVAGAKEYRCEDYGTNCPPTFSELVTMAAGLLFVISTLIGFARILAWCARKLSKLLV